MKWKCKLFGCLVSDYEPGCVNCGAGVYDADFQQEGTISGPIWRIRLWLRCNIHRVYRRCACCKKSMWFKPHECTCSDKCDSEWVPF